MPGLLSKLRPILTVVPAPVLAWVNNWLGIFTGSALYPHDHSANPDKTAAALATVAVIAGYFGFARAKISTQLIWGLIFLFGAVLCVASAFAVRESLRYE